MGGAKRIQNRNKTLQKSPSFSHNLPRQKTERSEANLEGKKISPPQDLSTLSCDWLAQRGLITLFPLIEHQACHSWKSGSLLLPPHKRALKTSRHKTQNGSYSIFNGLFRATQHGLCNTCNMVFVVLLHWAADLGFLVF